MVKDWVEKQGAPLVVKERVAALQTEITETERSLDRYQRLALAGRYGRPGQSVFIRFSWP